jgi:hypothetical protein
VVHAPERDEGGVGQGVDERVGGTGEVPVAQDDQHRQLDPTQQLGGQRRPRGPHARGQRLAVGVGVLGQAGEVLRHGVLAVARTLDGGGDDLVSLGAEQVGTDPRHHQAREPGRVLHGQGEQHPGAHREADGIDRAGRQGLGHEPLEVGVGRRVVGLGCGAVAEQVDGHRVPAGVAEQVEPAVLAPGAGARGGEAVDEDDGRIGHEGRG